MAACIEPGPNNVEPFWNRLPGIIAYPAQMAALVPIVTLGLAHLAGYAPLIGALVVLLVVVATYRYAFDCLRASANGEMEPPDFAWSDDSGTGWKLIGLMVVLGLLVTASLIWLGPKATMVLMLLLGLSLPGAIIVLAMEDSLLAALNPGKWLAVIGRIGWPYLAVVGLCVVVMFSQRYAQGWVAQVLPGFVAIILMAVISNYALVVTFHLMGTLVYQYHRELGYDPVEPEVLQALRKPDPDQDILDEAAALVRDGKPEEATARLRSYVRGRGGSPAVHRQYRKLLHLADDKQGLLKHGREYLNVLMAQENDAAALQLVRDCRTVDPSFLPEEGRQVTRLAHYAARMGQAKLAVGLLAGFHKRFPKSGNIVHNYLLVATLMHEHLNQDENARKVLRYLKAKYPDSPKMAEIDARLASVEKMLQATGKLAPKA